MDAKYEKKCSNITNEVDIHMNDEAINYHSSSDQSDNSVDEFN